MINSPNFDTQHQMKVKESVHVAVLVACTA